MYLLNDLHHHIDMSFQLDTEQILNLRDKTNVAQRPVRVHESSAAIRELQLPDDHLQSYVWHLSLLLLFLFLERFRLISLSVRRSTP